MFIGLQQPSSKSPLRPVATLPYAGGPPNPPNLTGSIWYEHGISRKWAFCTPPSPVGGGRGPERGGVPIYVSSSIPCIPYVSSYPRWGPWDPIPFPHLGDTYGVYWKREILGPSVSLPSMGTFQSRRGAHGIRSIG